MTAICNAISATVDALPSVFRDPVVAGYVVGGLFVAAGVAHMASPSHAAGEIKKSRFYKIGSSPSCGGCCNFLSLEKGNNLYDFTRLVGLAMAISGGLFASGAEQKFSSLAITVFFALFNIFIHLNLDAPLKTSPAHIAKFVLNCVLAAVTLSVGGWMNCPKKAL